MTIYSVNTMPYNRVIERARKGVNMTEERNMVSYLVKGWEVGVDTGIWHPFSKIVGLQGARKYLKLSEFRNDEQVRTKVDSIEVIW